MKSCEEKVGGARAAGRVLYLEGLDRVDDETACRWLDGLPPFRRQRAQRYRFAVDRLRCTAAFCLLSMGLGFVPETFFSEPNGKPFLPGGPHFNLSHGGACVAAALAAGPVGVDVETVADAPFEVMDRVFTSGERRQIEDSSDPNRAFYRFWTLKESALKWTGEGMAFPLLELNVTNGDPPGCTLPGCLLQAFETPQNQLAVCGTEAFEFVPVTLEALDRAWRGLCS